MNLETLKCQACDLDWQRVRIGGAKPRWCPACLPAQKKRLQAESGRRWYENGGREYSRQYQRDNYERCRASTKRWTDANPEAMRRIRLEWSYGQPVARIDALRATQMCVICKASGPGVEWHIDHDHKCCPGGNRRKCGQCIRGLLCADCNTLLGRVENDPVRFTALLQYALDNPRVDWSSLEAEVL